MKERLDVLLTENGYFQSREKAKAAIMAGIVWVDGQRSDKAGNMIDPDSDIEIRDGACPYVSRGGLKLEKALDTFEIDISDLVCCDMGASTGGFTDCMLHRGARRVFAIDVGYGQLDYKLRKDPRVVNMEKTNIRYLDTELIDDPASFISIDVSFISLSMILPVASTVSQHDADIVCLVKPQFEAGRQQVGKKGIVRDKNVHREVLANVISYGSDSGLSFAGVTYSPIKGAKGNIEYLLCLKKNDENRITWSGEDIENQINAVVQSAHKDLE